MSRKRKPSKPKIFGHDIYFHNCEPYLSPRGVEIVGIPSDRQRKRMGWYNNYSDSIFDGLICYRNEKKMFNHYFDKLHELCYIVGTNDYIGTVLALDDLYDSLRPGLR